MFSVNTAQVSCGQPRKTIGGRSNSGTKEAWRQVRCIRASSAAEHGLSRMAGVVLKGGSWAVCFRSDLGSAKVMVVFCGKMMS